jgi:serine-type D-Ala-D-Ala carboxypeptidase (penicillin-binding protein 5/6)
MCSGYFGALARRRGLRGVLGAAGAVLVAGAVGIPGAVAAPVLTAGGMAAEGQPQAIGGSALAGHGIVVASVPSTSGVPGTSEVPGAPGVPGRKLPGLPKVKASAFVIADAGTGQVLAAKDPHGWYRPASTLKMLTAVTLIPRLNPDATVVASKQATSVSPNVVGLVTGHAYRVSDLFTALLTISANDAAVALTQAVGSFGEGMTAINAEARHLQADDTVAVQPNGLDAPGQHTSAYDLALIARQALRLPAFLKYDETVTAKFPVSAKKSVTLFNQNELLTSYRGAVGGKIGWTSAAGATYVGMARRNGVTLIVTLLHCPALTEINSGKALLNWGFAVDGQVPSVGTLVSPLPAGTAAGTPSASGASGASGSGASGSAGSGVSGAGAGVSGSGGRGARVTAGGAGLSAGNPSVLAAGFSGVAVLVAGTGFFYSRRQRPATGDRGGPGDRRGP